MKKKLFLMCLIGLISITSVYAKCDGGTEITNSVGTTFCQSNVTMNWWSAAAWCKANKLQLATIYEMCPSWNGNTGSGKCPELSVNSSGYVWSATAKDNDAAFIVSLESGAVNHGHLGERKTGGKAFCR